MLELMQSLMDKLTKLHLIARYLHTFRPALASRIISESTVLYVGLCNKNCDGVYRSNSNAKFVIFDSQEAASKCCRLL